MGNAAAAGQTPEKHQPAEHHTAAPETSSHGWALISCCSRAAADQEIRRVRRARRCAGEVMAIINVAVCRREDQQAVAQPAGLLRIVGDKHHRATGQQGGRRV